MPYLCEEHVSFKALLTGVSGSGKTTYWLKAMLGWKARLKFVFDHKGEVAHRLKLKPCYTLKDIAAAAPSGWVVFNPSVMFKGRRPAAFLFFCEFAFEMSCATAGRKLICIDELQQFIGTNKVPDELGAVMEDGRLRSLDALLISSQPNIIHNRVRAQITEVVAFKTEEENALAWLQERGIAPERVKTLRKGQFICRNDQGEEEHGSVF